jgi:putative phosphoserine phosphatase/1-acylglycerol-3-phosphate O-acyltransferase
MEILCAKAAERRDKAATRRENSMSGVATNDTRVAAFFDLDGTLIPEPSLESRFFSALRKNHAVPLANYFWWGVEALRLLPKGFLAIQHGNKQYLKGLSPDLVFRHMDSISFFEEAIARVLWHVRQAHEIILVSGTPEALAQLAASALECELESRGVQARPHVCATVLSEIHGRWTGNIAGEALYGAAKARAVQNFAKQKHVDLSKSHAYGDSLLDRHFLGVVGHAHAVNAGKELAAIANERNWPIWHWHLPKSAVSQDATCLAKEIHHTEEPA